uniref:Zinc finger protein 76 n=1 Tax=Pipistrellus kuhlii TaxID=59472 RepID=A0A7J7YPZ9_PIPKU|nr:zinc finger protein 76 [Pipistrellus kuhlii]
MESLGLQTVTLSDGTTAYVQQAVKGEKLLEGQVIQLEDGTTAYIHQVTVQKEPLSFEDGQPVQLEDGSMAYIHRTPKGGATGNMAAGRKGDRVGRGVACPGRRGIAMEWSRAPLH